MCDVDGTLVVNRRNAIPSPRVIDTINIASKLIKIGIATSRPQYAITNILNLLNLSAPCIVNTGGQIIDPQSKKVLKEQPLRTKDIPAVLAILFKYSTTIYVDDYGNDIQITSSYTPVKPFNIFVLGLDLKIANTLVDELSHIPTISLHKTVSWESGKVDVIVAHARATKQRGILEVAQILNIHTDQIIGVGDGYNDFPLLMACGLKVAMGNAVPDLKAIADYIAPSVEDDGVAEVVEKFVLQKK